MPRTKKLTLQGTELFSLLARNVASAIDDDIEFLGGNMSENLVWVTNTAKTDQEGVYGSHGHRFRVENGIEGLPRSAPGGASERELAEFNYVGIYKKANDPSFKLVDIDHFQHPLYSSALRL